MLKITDIETIILKSPYEYGISEQDEESHGPNYSVIVKILTDEGIIGIGDIDSQPNIIKSIIDAPNTIKNICTGLRSTLIGENPLETDRLWSKMYQAGFYYGRRASLIHAMSGIDIALWDIKGKALNQSVSMLLGGRYHERIKAYASTLFRPTQDGMRRAVEKYRELGFKAIKFGWAKFTEDPNYGVKLVAAARKELGDEIDIMVDGYITYNDIKFAAYIINKLSDYGVFWVEEPLPSDNMVGLKKLSEMVSTRIATGEQLGGRYEYRDLIEIGDPDIVQFDVSRCGGITESKKIVFMAEMMSKLTCPHAWTSDILTAASLHINSNTEQPIFQEFCTNDSPISRDLCLSNIKLEDDGYIQVPKGIGLGVELNEETIKRYKVN